MPHQQPTSTAGRPARRSSATMFNALVQSRSKRTISTLALLAEGSAETTPGLVSIESLMRARSSIVDGPFSQINARQGGRQLMAVVVGDESLLSSFMFSLLWG
jgi:hypothetical protein